MGWVIYETKYGTFQRYTANETAAKRMVTRQNRAAIVAALMSKDTDSPASREWAYCSWADFESKFAEVYAKNTWRYRL